MGTAILEVNPKVDPKGNPKIDPSSVVAKKKGITGVIPSSILPPRPSRRAWVALRYARLTLFRRACSESVTVLVMRSGDSATGSPLAVSSPARPLRRP
jgi:hypothetical protein